MLIPRHWAPARGRATSRAGRHYDFLVWGWSLRSDAEAREDAARRLRELVGRVDGGDDPARGYAAEGERPVREQRVDDLGRAGDDPAAVVTRNRYGSLVLNTARIPFVDVDLPRRGALVRLARRLARRPDDAIEGLERVRAACAAVPSCALRLYRTAAGFRVLVTDPPLDPGGEEAAALMAAFAADPRFVRLCRAQGSFRARLTPKPWRCGCGPAPGRFPREAEADRARFEAWLAGYEAAASRWATCRFLEQAGTGRMPPEVGTIVAYHDHATRAQEPLPLA